MSFYYNEYVPVAVRRAKAFKKMDKLRKSGQAIEPIEPFKARTIASSFWGRSWCRHLESFSDYSNRLPRGRTYVRNGSVCHLEIGSEEIKAMVSGSEMYELSVLIEPLCPEKWSTIKNACKGKIGSLIELLQGKISDEIMGVVTDRENGLFPHPNEIRFNCNCPDWAEMCKHVAAAMYGIGVRLDTEPELLFKLRGVSHEELVSIDTAVDQITGGRRSRRRGTLNDQDLGNVFGVELETEEAPAFEATGASIRALRKKLKLSQEKFAFHLGVSTPSISKWENAEGALNLQAKSLHALEKAFAQTHRN